MVMPDDNNPFSMSNMSNALQNIRVSGSIPPPGFAPRASDVPDTRLKQLFNLMTSCEDVGQFKDLISTFDQSQLQMMASSLTSDSDYFMDVVSNKHGSRRVQRLLGISDDVDALFCDAILQRFFDIMTDKFASYVATRAVVVFDRAKKHAMYKNVLHYALDIASNRHGCVALNEVIIDADDPLFRKRLLDVVAHNAIFLSNDPWGNFVVQHVLKLYDLRCKRNVAVSLRGHCVDLSFKKYGSYIVEKLLDAEVSMSVVVVELLKCDGDRLTRLARSEYGNFVVLKALRVTQEMNRVDLFSGLVQKLMPFRHNLRRPHVNIANILESCSTATR